MHRSAHKRTVPPAFYSVISPEGCASVHWKDSSKFKEARECLKMTAEDLLRFKVIEKLPGGRESF
jgi:acetyl-CoA carboxylase carboxyl transferase subunit alpha